MPTSRKRKPTAKPPQTPQKRTGHRVSLIVLLVAAGTAAAIALWPHDRGTSEVAVPALSPPAQRGERLFAANCVTCHGTHAAGGPGGPPLVHRIYEPGHHGDAAFYLAVRRGVRQHHWQFGDMPPVPGLNDREIDVIVAYVRELQRANGID